MHSGLTATARIPYVPGIVSTAYTSSKYHVPSIGCMLYMPATTRNLLYYYPPWFGQGLQLKVENLRKKFDILTFEPYWLYSCPNLVEDGISPGKQLGFIHMFNNTRMSLHNHSVGVIYSSLTILTTHRQLQSLQAFWGLHWVYGRSKMLE